MRLTDQQIEQAIQILTLVKRQSGQPLPTKEEIEAIHDDTSLLVAQIRMVYPTVPEPPYKNNYERLWQSIVEGRYEGIDAFRSLDLKRALEDGYPPRLGSYFERWLSHTIKNELAKAIADGYRWR